MRYVAVFVLGTTAGIMFFIVTEGIFRKTREAPKVAVTECWCGDQRTCTFGPGIVGVQECRTLMSSQPRAATENRWTRCEPDPKYKVPP
jgi:hypothetical protein